MAYTTIDDPSQYFQTVLWSGDNADTRNITNDGNSDLQPDWVWIKSRDGSGNGYSHNVHDTSRGVDSNINKSLFIDQVDAEGGGDNVTTSAQLGGVSAMLSDGFTVKEGNTDDARYVNKSGNTYVAWQWKANGGNTTSVSASGTVLAGTYQANTTAGFSIMTYTGEDDTVNTVTHGLGAVPAWIIVKGRGSGRHWRVYHHKNTSAPETDYLRLNETGATTDDVNYWYDTAPTSSVFSISTANDVNANTETYVAYAFAEVQGYSKFGSYTGNGNADGPFVYTGFKPAWLMVRNTADSPRHWQLMDNKRSTTNEIDDYLQANADGAEATGSSQHKFDFLSNGFKLRGTADNVNDNGDTHIYMAFAEHPFVSSEGVPVTAR
tara:strand:+ start:441 stop:1574 length:1134 start_codon:yes stop_codon:yes gene_type:complete